MPTSRRNKNSDRRCSIPIVTIDAFGELTFAITNITAGSSMSISSAGVISTNLSNNASAGLTINNATGQIGLNCKDANKYYKTNATGVWGCSGLVTNDIATALGLTTGSTPKCDAATGKLHWTGSTFNCQTDKDTTYTAGTGITKNTSGNTAGAFSLDAGYMNARIKTGFIRLCGREDIYNSWRYRMGQVIFRQASSTDTLYPHSPGLCGGGTGYVYSASSSDNLSCTHPIVQVSRYSSTIAPNEAMGHWQVAVWDVGAAGFQFQYEDDNWGTSDSDTRGLYYTATCGF